MHDAKTLNNIIHEIKNSKRSLVLSHQNPDGDTLGSNLALGAILKKFGHVVDHVICDPVPEIYKFLPYANLVKLPDDKDLQRNYELAFSLDCGSLKRLGKSKDLWLSAQTTVNIDHHISNENFGKINWIKSEATSTGQMVYWLAKALNVKVTKEIATLLYTTLLTDTGCFSNSNTNSKAFFWASELIELGADHEKVYRKAFLERPLKAIKIFGTALSNLTLIEDGDLAWTYIDQDIMKKFSATPEDTEDIVDHIMRTKGVKVGVFFRDEGGETKVSFRSNIDLDVSKIAVSMGGGGHKRAAGINIKKSFNEVRDSILSQVASELRKYNGKKYE